jgi:hypothetical protein
VEDAGGSVDFYTFVEGANGEDGGVGAEVDGGGLDGGEKCGGELAGVEALFVEEYEMVVAGDERWEEVSKVFGSEFVSCAWEAGWKALQGCVGLEGDADAGESMEAIEEVWIEGETEIGKGTELGWIMRVAGGQHSSCGG